MAAKKTATKPVEDVAEVKDETTKPVEDVKPTKVYRFKSAYPALTVASLGVQFRGGYAEVTDVAVARALATIDGVEHIED